VWSLGKGFVAGRIVGNPEVMAQIGSSEDYFRLARHPGISDVSAMGRAGTVDLSRRQVKS